MADSPANIAPQIPADVAIGTGSTAPYRIERTSPDVLRRHDISDEELTMLADTKRDYLWEGKWVALGVCLGAAQSSANALYAAYWNTPPISLSFGDLLQVMFFFGGLVAFLILQRVMKKKTTDAKDLAAAIRERTARAV